MTVIVTLKGVSRTYQLRAERIEAIRDVTMSLNSSSMVALVGPSGSGKTTLLNLIVGWESSDEGEIFVDPSVADDWTGVAVVPQGIGLIPELSLIENMELPARLGNLQRLPTAELMDMLGLDGLGSRTPGEMSMGEQQRGAVARAAAFRPALLIADEPTAHQDERNVTRIMDLLARVADDGSAVLVATHDARVLTYFDTVIQLSDGRIR